MATGRINSDESIALAYRLLEQYGTIDKVMQEMRFRSDAHVAKTEIRLASRPSISAENHSITFEVAFLKEVDQEHFHILRLGSLGGVNDESLDNRNHMISEDVIRKKSLFCKALFQYNLFMRCSALNKAFAEKALAAWDEYEAQIEAGEVEIFIKLPSVGEGPGKRGYSKGSVSIRHCKADAKNKRR